MKKILVYCESPFVETGAAQVAKHILPVLSEYGEITAITVNSFLSPSADCQWKIIPGTKEDMLAIGETCKHIREDQYDLLFLTGDCNVLSVFAPHIRQRTSKKAIVVVYAAIDNEVFPSEYLDCLRVADVPVVFSHFAADIVTSAMHIQPDVIYHGCEPEIFYPLPEEERQRLRKESFGIGPETFLIGGVGRNQVRKDFARTMTAFKIFHERYSGSLLFFHSKQMDQGGSLVEQATMQGLIPGKNVRFMHPNFHEASGIDRDKMNMMYNCLDCVVSTSMGEGWGLCTTEAMAAGVPFIGPRNTVFPEIVGDERGWLVECGGPSLQYVHYGFSNVPRLLVNVDDLVEKMEEVRRIGEKSLKPVLAREWTQHHTWKEKQEEWRELLRRCMDE